MNIQMLFLQVCGYFDISDSLAYIISGNASIMAKAVQVHFMIGYEASQDRMVCRSDKVCKSRSPEEYKSGALLTVSGFHVHGDKN
mgnify:CR=1 FL=1